MDELRLHPCDEFIDVAGHALDSLDVVLVFSVDLAHELLDQVLLVINDLSAGGLLGFNVLFKKKEIANRGLISVTSMGEEQTHAMTMLQLTVRTTQSLRFELQRSTGTDSLDL